MRKMALFLAALAVAMPAGIADAQGGSGVRIRINYYSDAGYTNQTGEFVEFCDGSSTWNGQPDIHSQYFEYEC